MHKKAQALMCKEVSNIFVQEGPHQWLDNKLIASVQPPLDDDSIPGLRQVICRDRLGGLLKHYERRAA